MPSFMIAYQNARFPILFDLSCLVIFTSSDFLGQDHYEGGIIFGQ